MTSSLVLILSVSMTGGLFDFFRPGGRILDDQYGYYAGYRNGNPDGYGWRDYHADAALPLGANRNPDYFFPRYFASPADQLFFPTYYNPYMMRGQRYLAYSNCGGDHPAGGPARSSDATPLHPYNDTLGTGPVRPQPTFNGRVEAQPINPGTSGLRP